MSISEYVKDVVSSVNCGRSQAPQEEYMTDAISPTQFHESEGVEDWRVLGDGATAYFRTGSFAAAARLVQEISALPGLAGRARVRTAPRQPRRGTCRSTRARGVVLVCANARAAAGWRRRAPCRDLGAGRAGQGAHCRGSRR